MNEITLQFIGQRRQDFTVDGPVTGQSYYCTPGELLQVNAGDAEALITRDPHLWAYVTVPLAVEPPPEEDIPTRRKRNGTQ